MDSFRRRIYIAPIGLRLTLEAGAFAGVQIEKRLGTVRVALAPATDLTGTARLRIEHSRPTGGGRYRPASQLAFEREAYVVPLGEEAVWIELSDRN